MRRTDDMPTLPIQKMARADVERRSPVRADIDVAIHPLTAPDRHHLERLAFLRRRPGETGRAAVRDVAQPAEPPPTTM